MRCKTWDWRMVDGVPFMEFSADVLEVPLGTAARSRRAHYPCCSRLSCDEMVYSRLDFTTPYHANIPLTAQ